MISDCLLGGTTTSSFYFANKSYTTAFFVFSFGIMAKSCNFLKYTQSKKISNNGKFWIFIIYIRCNPHSPLRRVPLKIYSIYIYPKFRGFDSAVFYIQGLYQQFHFRFRFNFPPIVQCGWNLANTSLHCASQPEC